MPRPFGKPRSSKRLARAGHGPSCRLILAHPECLCPPDTDVTVSAIYKCHSCGWGRVAGGRAAPGAAKRPTDAVAPITAAGGRALVGLWENWRSAASERLCSFAIITTRSNELCAELHDPVSLILPPAWLGEKPADSAQLRAMLSPYPLAEMTCLAAEHPGRQRQEQRSQPDRADRGGIGIALPAKAKQG
jgi:hypothetical protein